jgi:hypothetical protein
MLADYFPVIGLIPFTWLLVQTVVGTLRRLSRSSAALSEVAASSLSLAVIAAIETAFVVLLARAIALPLHPPAVPSF